MATIYGNIMGQLEGSDRDAAAALIDLFQKYGLESLSSRIIDYVKQGFSTDTMAVMLQETPEYQKRFYGNELRKKAGLAALSPAEYIATERQYRQVMQDAGMPKGFYDQTSDFEKFIGNDMSPTELQDRVKAWQDVAQQDHFTTEALQRMYGMSTSDYAAYLMDPQRALPILQNVSRAVDFAAAGARHGISVSTGTAQGYGGGAYQISKEDAEKGFAAIEATQADTDRLAKMYGLGGYSAGEAIQEVFGNQAAPAKKRQKAASEERATFQDTSKGATGSASKNSY